MSMYLNYIEVAPKGSLYDFLKSIDIQHFYSHPDDKGLSTSESKKLKILDRAVADIITISGIKVTQESVEFYKCSGSQIKMGMDTESIKKVHEYIDKLEKPSISTYNYNIYLIDGYKVYILCNKDDLSIHIGTTLKSPDLCHESECHVFAASTGTELYFPWIIKYDYICPSNDLIQICNHIA